MALEKNLPLVTRDAGEQQKTEERMALEKMAGNMRILAESIKPGSSGDKEITFDELGRIAVEQRQLQEFFEKHLKVLVQGILGTGELNPKKALEKVRQLQAYASGALQPPSGDSAEALSADLEKVQTENDRLEGSINEVLAEIPDAFRIRVRPNGTLEESSASLAASVSNLVKAAHASERGEELLERTRKLSEMVQVACAPGNFNYSPYLYGMANMGIFALSVLTGVEPAYLDQPKKWLEKDPVGVSPPVEAAIGPGEKGKPS